MGAQLVLGQRVREDSLTLNTFKDKPASYLAQCHDRIPPQLELGLCCKAAWPVEKIHLVSCNWPKRAFALFLAVLDDPALDRVDRTVKYFQTT